MKKEMIAATTSLFFLLIAISPMHTYAQEDAGYTFLSGASGPMVCLGKWVPSSDRALPGNCYGQLMDLGQFSAASARLSADRMDQVVNVLSSIDQRLSINTNQLQSLITVTENLQKSIDRQAAQDNLEEAIERRFDSLPEDILSNELFKKEISRLKEDILKEIELRSLKKKTQAK